MYLFAFACDVCRSLFFSYILERPVLRVTLFWAHTLGNKESNLRTCGETRGHFSLRLRKKNKGKKEKKVRLNKLENISETRSILVIDIK